MYKREEASRIREEFWTAFGRYMSPVPSVDGGKANWINYRTGLKDVFFRMEVSKRSALISISLEHREAALRELYFHQFQQLKGLLEAATGEEWDWREEEPVTDNKVISTIRKELINVSVFNKEDWPALISFFKPRIIALDRFWENAKYSFEEFGN